MKTAKFARGSIILLLALAACTDDSMGDLGGLVDNFVADISRGWKDESSNSFYFFIPDSTNVPKGTFTGSRQNADSSETPELTGSYTHEHVQFTFTSGNPKGITYKGIIDTLHPDHMRLANTLDSLHDSIYLIQQP